MTQTTERPAPRPAAAGGRRGPGQRIGLYYKQVVGELRKVLWPTRRELITYTGVAIVFVVAMVMFVWLLDLGFTKGVLQIFG